MATGDTSVQPAHLSTLNQEVKVENEPATGTCDEDIASHDECADGGVRAWATVLGA